MDQLALSSTFLIRDWSDSKQRFDRRDRGRFKALDFRLVKKKQDPRWLTVGVATDGVYSLGKVEFVHALRADYIS